MNRRYLDRVYLREPVPANSYLAALPAVRALGDREHPLKIPADVTFLVGENGTGKSTLLEAVAVACGFNAEGGTRNFSFSTRETHSPILMSYPGACIYQLSEAGIIRVDYRDTEHYQLTRRFLEAPEQMMELLFQEL